MYTEEEIHDLLKRVLRTQNLKKAKRLINKFIKQNNIDLFAEFESDSDSPELIENIDDWIPL